MLKRLVASACMCVPLHVCACACVCVCVCLCARAHVCLAKVCTSGVGGQFCCLLVLHVLARIIGNH